MDTEGLNSVRTYFLTSERDINVDLKIFSLSVLLSSVFIYNSYHFENVALGISMKKHWKICHMCSELLRISA